MTGSGRTFKPRLAFSRPEGEARVSGAVADRERFGRLILPHMDAAYNFARYLARDPAAAEDIVQEAFLRSFRAIQSCRSNEKAWLFAIVRNCFHDWVRAHGRTSSAALTEVGALVEADGPEIVLQRRDTQLTVRETVEALPEPFREALVLRELEELSYREIAGLTGAPIGTVMSRLARARQMLATLLLARDDGEAAS